MFDAWLNSEVFRTVVAVALFGVTCVVMLFVLLAYLDFGKRLKARAVSDAVHEQHELPHSPATLASVDE
ncbi:MAG TPA: hypothetical protein VE861_00165 [Gemmatimonadaceae bacterium]|nr:hypothetical protein [Gemmatimonadaceae bacterium]